MENKSTIEIYYENLPLGIIAMSLFYEFEALGKEQDPAVIVSFIISFISLTFVI